MLIRDTRERIIRTHTYTQGVKFQLLDRVVLGIAYPVVRTNL